jgi:hypothetical protein
MQTETHTGETSMNATPAPLAPNPRIAPTLRPETPNPVEMLDGIPVDRRPALNVMDRKEVDAFIADIRRGKKKITDVRLVSPTPFYGEGQDPKLTKAMDYIVKNARPTAKQVKQQRKADRPSWRR